MAEARTRSRTSSDKIKDDFDRQFAIVVSGAERTRGVLYFFGLILIVNLVFFFEDAFNTSGRRLDIMSAAVSCFSGNLSGLGKVPFLSDDEPNPGDEDLLSRERHCGFYYSYVNDNYHVDLYADRASKSPVSQDHPKYEITKTVLLEKYKAVLKDDTDYLSTSIPLLNIRVDRNDGLILQNIMAVLIVFTLLVTINAERKAPINIGQIVGSHPNRIASLLDAHVFNRTIAGQAALSFAIFLPVVSQIYRVWQDITVFRKTVNSLYGPTWGSIYLFIEPFSLWLMLIVASYCVLESLELRAELRVLGSRPKMAKLLNERDVMNRRLDLLAILLLATGLALIAVPVLARVNP